MLTGKCILVGVSGGIAAYKSADLVSALVKAGAEVHVIMTSAAQEFITPMTMQTLSRNPVVTGLFDKPGEWQVRHVALADRAHLMVIAPATANIIGKVAHGLADDSLSTTIMACKAPVCFAPAMNVHMYENPIVQQNITSLTKGGYSFIEPGWGRLACGYEGKGRMAEVGDILAKIKDILAAGANLNIQTGDLTGKTVLITAGGTREAIDPVRYIANRSSGKMGYAIARKARERGAEVILVSGPSQLEPPQGVTLIPVESAQEMYNQVLENFQQAEIIIKAAAVADYRPKEAAEQKLKKTKKNLTLSLEPTQDILMELGRRKGQRILVGFAAETENLIANAQDKLKRKNVDFIVANDVTKAGAGFGSDTNIVKFIFPSGKIEELPLLTKAEVANKILDQIVILAEKEEL